MAANRFGYKQELTEEDKAKAKEELGEDPEQTSSHLETLRGALKTMKHFTAPEDDEFLLLFLRRAKFSQMKARELIDTFIKCRVTEPFNELYVASSSLDPQVMKCYEAGVCMAVPRLTKSGVRTLVFRANAIDLNVVSLRDAMRAATTLVEIVLQDPVTQVHGIQYVIDDYEATLSYYGQLMSPTTTRIAASAFLSTTPGRMKGLHICRGPTIVAAAVSLLKGFVSSKISSRMHIHGTAESVRNVVEASVLPEELGGTAGTYAEIARGSVDYVLKNKGMLDRYKSIRYEADKKVDGDLTGTFRKLAV